MQGSSLDSVDRSEITVTVGGQPCREIASTEDENNTVRDLYVT